MDWKILWLLILLLITIQNVSATTVANIYVNTSNELGNLPEIWYPGIALDGLGS
jgi:hypothetical protein